MGGESGGKWSELGEGGEQHAYIEVVAALARRIYPGFVFKHGKAGWRSLLEVTDHSMSLMWGRMETDWRDRPEQVRRKWTKKDAEEIAETAALVEALFVLAQKTTPLKKEDLGWVFLLLLLLFLIILNLSPDAERLFGCLHRMMRMRVMMMMMAMMMRMRMMMVMMLMVMKNRS